ncbi:MAG: PRC-barrel domain-containing protein, partial [Pelovirga sp.]
MLHKANNLKNYTLNSRDGEIGKVKEFFFDEQHWAIRYLVADTVNWHTGRQVMISPGAMMAVNTEKQMIDINLTKEQIARSP